MSSKWLLISVAIAGGFLGVKDLLPVIPGPDLHVSEQIQHTRIAIKKDSPDIKSWIRLTLRGDDNAGPIRAALENGEELDTIVERGGGGGFTVRVQKRVDPGRPQVPFDWPAGIDLLVSVSQPVHVSDWTIYVADQGSDSKKKQQWRTFNKWAVGILGLITILGAAVAAARARSRPEMPLTAHACIVRMINETEDLAARKILTRVLIARLPPELPAAGPARVRAQRAVFRSASEFSERLDQLVQSLQDHYLLLNQRISRRST